MRWLDKAHEYDGMKEIAGAKHNPRILELWVAAKLPFKDDETPWCAGFVNGVLEQVDIPGTRSGMARSFLKWGKKLDNPIPGCVVVIKRGTGAQGHVGFVTHVSANTITILGGNQNNAVNERVFSKDTVLGYRWPNGEPIPNKKEVSRSKIANTAAGVGTVEAGDVALQFTDALEKVQPLKDASDSLGFTDTIVKTLGILAHNPRFWIALAVVAAAVAIWYWRRKDH